MKDEREVAIRYVAGRTAIFTQSNGQHPTDIT
jgi:hypothetical protein